MTCDNFFMYWPRAQRMSQQWHLTYLVDIIHDDHIVHSEKFLFFKGLHIWISGPEVLTPQWNITETCHFDIIKQIPLLK
ncbi:hypothetical protein Bpfe_018644, partial [Biomphalaria pfeifferi]